MNGLNYVLCDYVTESLCSLYILIVICMRFYDCYVGDDFSSLVYVTSVCVYFYGIYEYMSCAA